MSIENHGMICAKRGKNPSQPINSPFTGWVGLEVLIAALIKT
jgi:hypothetical protein